jgi:hypothetical protein
MANAPTNGRPDRADEPETISVNENDALAVALLERLRTQRLPRALDIKAKVDAGGTLDDFDIAFLEDVLADAEQLKPWVDREPEYQDISARVIHLYHEITARALANESGSAAAPGGTGP